MTRVDEAMRRLKEGKIATPAAVASHEVVPFGQGTEFWPSEQGSGPETAIERALQPAADLPLEPVSSEPAFADSEVLADLPAPSVETPSQDVPEAIQERVVTTATDASLSIEQYRRLAARLHLAQAESGIKTVMIASAIPGEGKTLTATNLALTLSQSYSREVLLIDGDLRRPSLHDMFGLPNLNGLNDGVKNAAESKVPVTHVRDRLTLLTAGRPDPDPMSVLTSERMQRVISEARGRFDWVIVDTPPVGLLTDAKLLAAFVDVVIVVIRAGETRFEAIQNAINAMGREKIFGVVLNHAAVQPGEDYRYQYYAPVRS